MCIRDRTIPNLDIPIHELSPGSASFDRDKYSYIDAKNKVVVAATHLPTTTMVAPVGGDGWARLIGVRHYDDNADLGAAVLRPYECARVGGSPAGCASDDGDCIRHDALRGDLNCSENYVTAGDIYKNEPLIVTLRAEVDTILPMLPKITVEGSAYGFREEVPRATVDLKDYGVADPTAASSTVVNTSTTTSVVPTTTTDRVAACVADWEEAIEHSGAFPRCPNESKPGGSVYGGPSLICNNEADKPTEIVCGAPLGQ